MSDKDVVRFSDCKAVKESPAALLVEIPDADRSVWIPKRVIDEDSEVYALDTEGELVIPRWLAEKEELE